MQNLIKSSLLSLALALSAGTLAHAQQPQTAAPSSTVPQHQPNPKHQAKEFAKRLSLTSDQTAQVEPIFADRDQRLQTLMSNSSADPKTLRQQRRAIMMDFDQKVTALLTPAQQQQYSQLKAERSLGKGSPAAAPATPPSL